MFNFFRKKVDIQTRPSADAPQFSTDGEKLIPMSQERFRREHLEPVQRLYEQVFGKGKRDV